jgi:hypothetical protein
MRRHSALALVAFGLAAAVAVPGASGIPGDPTPPVITPVITAALGNGGWYVTNVTVNWKVEDPESGTILSSSGCNATTLTADTPGTRLTCAASSDGGDATASKTIKLDKTAPAVAGAAPDRPADAGGWYTRPVTVAFSGTDAVSGVESCSTVTYSGPDSGSAAASGTCRDHAGNVSAAGSFALKFDATAPAVTGAAPDRGPDSGGLSWKRLAPWEFVTIRRSPGRRKAKQTTVYRGHGKTFTDRSLRNGVTYRYLVVASDPASNRATKTVKALPKGPLLAPAEEARVSAPPLLKWVPVRRAAFYNVQLFRNGRKIFSAWPVWPRLQLRRTWVWNARRHRLAPATYRWFVWPAYKRRGQTRYGKPLGHSDFAVARPS